MTINKEPMTWFRVLSSYESKGAEENHEKPQSIYTVSTPRFEPGTSQNCSHMSQLARSELRLGSKIAFYQSSNKHSTLPEEVMSSHPKVLVEVVGWHSKSQIMSPWPSHRGTAQLRHLHTLPRVSWPAGHELLIEPYCEITWNSCLNRRDKLNRILVLLVFSF